MEQQSTPTLLSPTRYIVLGGGTGCNYILEAFSPSQHTTFVLPISDDGGSSSEIQRVLGGPSIGDIRSRLVRLIPGEAIRILLGHRLEEGGKEGVKKEWRAIVEGRHPLWKGIPNDRKECIRAFLVHVEAAILKKAQRGFSWKRASIGNLFLTGASMFLGNMPSAIFLFASLTEIPHDRFTVLPVINTSSIATIAAELENREILIGQSEISHPPTPSPTASPPPRRFFLLPPPSPLHLSRAPTPSLFEAPILGDEDPEEEEEEDEEKSTKVNFSKQGLPELSARIKRIFYINQYGSEIFPKANPGFVEALNKATCLVFSPGSLYTSVLPLLVLPQIANSIINSPSIRTKILLLNSVWDRETPVGYTAIDFVKAIGDGLSNSIFAATGVEPEHGVLPSDFLTHLVYLEGSEIPVDVEALSSIGIKAICVAPSDQENPLFDERAVREAFNIIGVV